MSDVATLTAELQLTKERFDTLRRDHTRVDEELAELRTDVVKKLDAITESIAAIEKTQALQAQALATGGAVVNKLVYVGVALAIIILGSALGIIAFGPSA